MKNVSRSSSSSSKFSSCFRPVVDLDAMLDPPPPSLHRSSSFRMACLPPKHHTAVDHHPPKPTFSLLFKALAIQTRVNVRARPSSGHGSKRRSSGDDRRTMLNQDTEASNIPETKAEPPSFCWSSGSESESLSEISYSDIPDDKERWREGKSEKQKKSEWLGIFMVVFSLSLTVLVGKYWGALLTSAWLYLLCLVKAGNEKTSPGQEEQSRGGMVGS